MTRRLHRNCPHRRGASLVEMALVLPIFVAVTLGIVEFGRAMMVGQLITNAARQGVREAIVDGSTNAAVTTSIKSFLQSSVGVAPGDVTVQITVTEEAGNPAAGNEVANASAKDLVTVHVSVPFSKVHFVPGKYLEGKNLAGQAAMRHE